MWSLVTWNEGNKPYLFLIETEKLAPYRYLNGLIVNEDHMSEDDNDTIVHLAKMLGREPHDGPIPPLEDYLTACRKLINRKDVDGHGSVLMTDVESAEREAKLNKGPWSEFVLKAPFDVSRYVNDVFVTGWYS